MIQLKNVNKYYYRHKKNEIHVINDTSLELRDTGLVALLGPSGCGKTTLLNAIGGLDKIQSGNIFIDGIKMPRIGSSKKDKLRVLKIGYIFQNYNLLDNMSVYENVALSLKMIGIKNKSEIKRRVDYILEAVGMYRYRNKPAGMLSGGQRQRVGIARALVKNPEVIIADEPTGNLDSKNTIEIMNIIKAISQNKLVILVTHEKDLAHFYASRIIELEDGKVLKDYENDHENELDYRIDNKIYLKDFEVESRANGENHNINIYSDANEKVNLDIVIKNGNIYIRSKNKNKIEVVDEESGIEFIDDNYKKISKEDYTNSTFDLKELDNSHVRLHYTSIYNIFTMLKTGFKKVANYTMMKKILLIGFFVSAMFIVYSISSIFGSLRIEDKDFLSAHRDYISIENNTNSVDEFLKIEELDIVDFILPGDSNIKMSIEKNELYQFHNSLLEITGSMAETSLIDENSIIYGKLPFNKNEIVIDKLVIDRAKADDTQFQMVGLKTVEDFVGEKVKIGQLEFVISGISDSANPCIYINREHFMNVLAQSNSQNDYDYGSMNNESSLIQNYDLRTDDITLKSGNAPVNDYEVIVNIDFKESMPLNKTISTKINDQKLKVVGYFQSKTGDQSYYVSANTYKYNTIKSLGNMTIYSKDKDKAIEVLQSAGYNAKDSYNFSKEKYKRNIKDNVVESLIVAGILLAISFVEIFLMIRASFLSRIKEVGIYRAVGVKKTDIYKMFLGEILIITTIAGVTGVILMSSILNEVTKISIFDNMYVMDARVVLASLILVYGLNIIVGLLPIRQTIKKSPAEILSRNDVD